jgi:muconolactone delta-isomerase
MLFHVTMTHTAGDCPAYDRQKMADVISGMEKLDAVAAELKVKVHMLAWGAPEHVAYALLEADSLAALMPYVNAIPLRQDFKVTPVQHLKDVVAMSKLIMARQ